MIIEIELWGYSELKTNYPKLINTIEYLLPSLTSKQVSKVASIAIDNCHSCHNADSSCQCWNDE